MLFHKANTNVISLQCVQPYDYYISAWRTSHKNYSYIVFHQYVFSYATLSYFEKQNIYYILHIYKNILVCVCIWLLRSYFIVKLLGQSVHLYGLSVSDERRSSRAVPVAGPLGLVDSG